MQYFYNENTHRLHIKGLCKICGKKADQLGGAKK